MLKKRKTKKKKVEVYGLDKVGIWTHKWVMQEPKPMETPRPKQIKDNLHPLGLIPKAELQAQQAAWDEEWRLRKQRAANNNYYHTHPQQRKKCSRYSPFNWKEVIKKHPEYKEKYYKKWRKRYHRIKWRERHGYPIVTTPNDCPQGEDILCWKFPCIYPRCQKEIDKQREWFKREREPEEPKREPEEPKREENKQKGD